MSNSSGSEPKLALADVPGTSNLKRSVAKFPGGGLAAARLNDPTIHGGVISSASPNVVIGGKPAARVTDMHSCPMINPDLSPHVGGPVIPAGSPTVKINFRPAARVTDRCQCSGPTDAIAMGEATVLIG